MVFRKVPIETIKPFVQGVLREQKKANEDNGIGKSRSHSQQSVISIAIVQAECVSRFDSHSLVTSYGAVTILL